LRFIKNKLVEVRNLLGRQHITSLVAAEGWFYRTDLHFNSTSAWFELPAGQYLTSQRDSLAFLQSLQTIPPEYFD
jgi:hypothetical protein